LTMMSWLKKSVLVLTGVVVIAAGLVAVGMYRDARRARTELETLRAEVVQLARSVRTTPQSRTQEDRPDRAAPAALQPQRVSAAVRPMGQATQDAVPVNQPTSETMEQQTAAAMEVRAQALAGAYTQEARDLKWSPVALEALQQAHAANPKLAALSIASDCRATMCRVDFSFQGVPDGFDAVRSLLEVHAWPGTQFAQVDRSTKQGSAFIAREGFELPRADLPASM
jgi:cytoskeletal protein RodZ